MAWHINNRKKERTSHVRSIFFPFMPIAPCVFFFIHSVHRCICFACSTPVKLKSLSFSREHFTVELFFKHNLFSLCGFCAMQTMDEHFFRFWCFKFNLFFEHVLRWERKGKKPSGKQKEFNSFSRDSVSYYGFLPVIFGSVAFLPFQKKFDCLLTHIVPCFNIQYFFIHF